MENDTKPSAGIYTNDTENNSRSRWLHRTWRNSHFTWRTGTSNYSNDSESVAGSYTNDSKI